MKPDNTDIYDRWKHHRCGVSVPPDFSDRVMTRIKQHHREDAPRPVKGLRNPTQLLVLRWALGSTLLLIGVFRLSFVTIQLLIP